MSSLYFVIATVIVATNAETKQCSKDTTCSCTQSGLCTLECIGNEQCKGSNTVLNCKQGQSCVIICNSDGGKEACLDTTINANGAIKVEITCSGELACKSSQLNCGSSLSCSTRCTGTLGCEAANVNCGSSTCSLSCESQSTCTSIQVDASVASSFNCYNDCTNSGIPPNFPTSAPTKVTKVTKPTTANPTTTTAPLSTTITVIPTTLAPTSPKPTTSNPTTNNPTTNSPTITVTTTAILTTANPTTSNPTTYEPTTFNPTTTNPTTAYPTQISSSTSYSTTNARTTSLETSYSSSTLDTTTTEADSKSGLVTEADVTSETDESHRNDNAEAKAGFSNLTKDPMTMSVAAVALFVFVVLLICCYVFCRKYRNRTGAPQQVIKMNSNALYFESNMAPQQQNTYNQKFSKEGDGLEYEGDVTTNKNSLHVFQQPHINTHANQNNNISNKVNNNYVMQGQGMNTNGYPAQHNMIAQTKMMPNLPPVPAPPEIIVANDAIMATNNTNNLGVQRDLESPDSPLTATVDTPMDMSPIGFETPVGVVDTLTMMVQKHTNETDRGNDLELIQENDIENNNNNCDENEDECYDDDEEVLNGMENILTTPGNIDLPPVPAPPEILVHNDNDNEIENDPYGTQ